MTNDELSRRIDELEGELETLRNENNRFQRFVEIGRLLGAERNIDKLIPLIMNETRKAVEADRSTLFLIDMDRSELWTKYAQGMTPDQKIRIDLRTGIAGLCVITGRLLNVTDVYEDMFFDDKVDQKTGYRTQSVLCAPFFNAAGEAVGAIELINKRTGIFTKDDEEQIQKTSLLLTHMARAGDLQKDMVESAIANLRSNTDSERGSFFLLDHDNKRLCSLIAEGLEDTDIRVNLNLGIAGYVAISGVEVNIENAYDDPRFNQASDQATGYRTTSILCLPIKNLAGEVLGVTQVLNRTAGPFTQDDMELLKALTPQIAIAIENAILFQEQSEQCKSVLEVLAASIDAKDPLTAGHSHKVAEYASGIARELGFGDLEADILTVSALLHDYGKIGVSDEILKKPGNLTPSEYEHIKQHVTCTKSILSKMRFVRKYRNVPMIASCHHERLDGSGYGSGLKSHEIPFMSKILAVADVFEALTAKRHYRDAMKSEEAFRVLETGIGTQFDGSIVQALKAFWSKRIFWPDPGPETENDFPPA